MSNSHVIKKITLLFLIAIICLHMVSCMKGDQNISVPAPVPAPEITVPPQDIITPEPSVTINLSDYPFRMKPLSADKLSVIKKGFEAQHKGSAIKLNAYGFIEKVTFKESEIKIENAEEGMENTKKWLIKNSRLTGVKDEKDLVIADVKTSSESITGTNNRKTTELRICFQGQKYYNLPLVSDWPYNIPECHSPLVEVSAAGLSMNVQWFSDIIVPLNPEIPENICRQKLAGKIYSYSNMDGSPASHKITEEGLKNPGKRVVFVKKSAGGLEFRLAWEIIVGTGLTWTVYIDAITGEELGKNQNFRT